MANNANLRDTGERMIPKYHKGHLVYGEHIVRYEVALQLVRGKKVLDIASGSGYGSSILSRLAESVVGVDINKDSVIYSNDNYASSNTKFIEGDAESIPLGDKQVDVVVCFETIEHVKNYRKFLSEIRRVLKDDGMLVLSTPNDVEFPESNKFHLHEFKRDEIVGLVKKYFHYVKLYYQGAWLYSAIFDQGPLSSEWLKQIDTLNTAPIKPDESVYFLLVCSNKTLKQKVRSLAAISEHWSARKHEDYEESVRRHIDEQAKIIEHLKNRAESAERRSAELEKTINSHTVAKLKLYTKRMLRRSLDK